MACVSVRVRVCTCALDQKFLQFPSYTCRQVLRSEPVCRHWQLLETRHFEGGGELPIPPEGWTNSKRIFGKILRGKACPKFGVLLGQGQPKIGQILATTPHLRQSEQNCRNFPQNDQTWHSQTFVSLLILATLQTRQQIHRSSFRLFGVRIRRILLRRWCLMLNWKGQKRKSQWS